MAIDFRFIPRATYCQPQIGSMGLSEAQAREAGHDVKTATFPFSANGKAMGLGEPVGFVKVIADAEHNEILGAALIGPDVTELLPVLNLAQTWDLTADEVSRTVFAHPTLGEAVKEAVARHRRTHDQLLSTGSRADTAGRPRGIRGGVLLLAGCCDRSVPVLPPADGATRRAEHEEHDANHQDDGADGHKDAEGLHQKSDDQQDESENDHGVA